MKPTKKHAEQLAHVLEKHMENLDVVPSLDSLPWPAIFSRGAGHSLGYAVAVRQRRDGESLQQALLQVGRHTQLPSLDRTSRPEFRHFADGFAVAVRGMG